MAKRKKPSLSKALKKVEVMDENFFGDVEIDIDSLPCIARKKEKITANFDSEMIKIVKAIADRKKVPYTSIMNDLLVKIVVERGIDEEEAS